MTDLNGIEIFVYLFCNAFGIYVIFQFAQLFLKKGTVAIRKCLGFANGVLYWLVSSAGFLYYHWQPTIMIVLTIIGITVISFTYLGKWKYRICAVVIITAIRIISEDISYYLLVKLHTQQLFIVGVLAAQIISYMILLLLQKVVYLKDGEEFRFSDWISVIVIPIWSLFISAVVLDGCKNEAAIAIGGTSMLLINVLVFYILSRMQNVYRKQLELNLLEQQNKAYEHQMIISRTNEERITALHHDIKNHFLALNHLAEEGKSEDIKMYLKSLDASYERQNQIVATGNYMLDGFLNMKLLDALKYGAEIDTEIHVSRNLNIDVKDISIILGNLLDNALRAVKCITSEKKRKYISVLISEEPGKLYLKIKNSHCEKIRNFGGVFQTTKKNKEGHGIGLKNVEKIVDAYSGHMEVEHTDDWFSVEIIMFI